MLKVAFTLKKDCVQVFKTVSLSKFYFLHGHIWLGKSHPNVILWFASVPLVPLKACEIP